MDTWRDMGHMSNLSELDKRGLKNHFGGEKTPDFWSGREREEKREKNEKKKNPNFSL